MDTEKMEEHAMRQSTRPENAIRYEHYRGKKTWVVKHPDHKKAVRVTAPDRDTPMIAAAEYWRETWTALDFYTRCTVEEVAA